jgi:hypothetical protein
VHRSPAGPSPSPVRSPRTGVVAAALGVVAAVALGLAAPASAAIGVVSGQAADTPNDAPKKELDVVSASATFNRDSARMKATIQMAAKPEGDVDVQFGITQPGGACATELTLRTTVSKGTAQLYGSAGNVRRNATVSFAAGGTITTSVTDGDLAGKKNIDCFAVRVYGVGANHALRDSLGPVAMTERSTPPPTECLPDDPACTPPPECLPEDPTCAPPVCTTEADCPVDPCYPGDPSTTGDVPVTGYAATDGVPAGTRGAGDGVVDCPPIDDGTGGYGAAPDVSVRFYGLPKRLRRGRSYDLRIRLRNAGDADARRLKVRLTRKTGVAMSRRLASVSNVRSGKGITVHVRVRLTSAQAKRTVRVRVTGADVDVERSFVLRRRGAR